VCWGDARLSNAIFDDSGQLVVGLSGFDSRADVIRRYEEMIGRTLADLDWYEIFAVVRVGCCILRTQVLLRTNSRADHFLTRAPILPVWTIEAIRR
jgi:aminoglycoside phosphotransferase (APT) family kinase protein